MKDSSLKIMLVEDNPGDVRLVQMMLRDQGDSYFELEHASSLTQGLRRLDQEDFDLILLDLGLPERQGLDTLRAVLIKAPSLPIVVLTGLDNETIGLQALQIGAQDYLIKDQITGSLLVRSIRYAAERKRTEEALVKSEQRYRELFENAILAVFQVTFDGRQIIAANPKFAQIFGYESPNEIYANVKDSANLFADPQRQAEILRMKAKSPDLTTFENMYRRKDGSTFWGRLNVRQAITPDKSDPILEGFIEDITEQKLVEKRLEVRNAEMERFVYTISHELRAPLVSIGGLLGFLKQDAEKGNLDQIMTDYQMANNTLSKMDQLLGETLELSKIGRIANPLANVPFSEIVKEALDLVTEKLKSRCIDVSVAEECPIVNVDRVRLVEVLINLIENSTKYMGDQAHPKIEIGHREDEKETVFFVRDNGIGIDPSQHDKVFELFYRIDKKSEGTGAGLTIVKRIIQVHSGRIWIESVLGKGCTVCFTLPLALNLPKKDGREVLAEIKVDPDLKQIHPNDGSQIETTLDLDKFNADDKEHRRLLADRSSAANLEVGPGEG